MSLEVAYAPISTPIPDLTPPRPRSAPPPPVDPVPMMLGITSFTKTAAALAIHAALRALSLSPRPLWAHTHTDPFSLTYGVKPSSDWAADQPVECASVDAIACDADNVLVNLDCYRPTLNLVVNNNIHQQTPLSLGIHHVEQLHENNGPKANSVVVEQDLISERKSRSLNRVKFVSHLGQVRFFRHTEKPTDVSLAKWKYIDEPAQVKVDYTVTTPNWSPSMPGIQHSAFYASPNIYTKAGLDPTQIWDDEAVRFTYNAGPAVLARIPCPWDVVFGETVQVIVGLFGNCTTPTTTDMRVKILGTVVVANRAVTKRVTVRASFDFWNSFTDLACTYVNQTDSPGFERWRYVLDVDLLSMSKSFHAISVYLCFHFEYLPSSGISDSSSTDQWESVWDNNNGSNYQVDIKRKSISRHESGGLNQKWP